MSLYDQMRLSQQPDFQGRVAGAAVHTALAIQTEVVVDQQTITMGAVTAGTFTLSFGGQTTAAIQWNASASAVQTALNLLTSITAGGVECTGGPLPGTGVVVNFVGTNLVGAQPAMTHTDTLTGGVATITHTTVGTWVLSHAKRSALASKVLANPTGYGQLMAMGVADNATVISDFQVGAYWPINGIITGATNANPIVITSANHGLISTQSVTISGVLGNLAANGTFVITKIDANTFSIPVAGSGAYTSGGTWVLSEGQVGNDIQFQMNSIFTSYG
jgi:hypothetical protein